ncbi:preprotein translocase subunit SecE [Cesiribacter sp. SM1]|jgi:preprotein translocase subunit SecE|uniref:preprotein translocase subunit SecE n=1 Tax=Cesiribacter sp. SM1 TaxID=2861196 RepID=UPI001CD2A9BE|nr:preprotein translocase subunit SecE [Cesiribacter sp. SM1]
MEKLKLFVAESYEEMKHKVTWPKYGELQRSSILVLVASLIFALTIGLIDLAFENALEWFYKAF